jgi:AcrR family transcriptional regulator
MNDLFLNIDPNKRSKIIEAGLIEFSQQGYINGSTNHIVKAVSISKGSLFKYFNSKKDFYLFLVNHVNEKLLKFLNENFKPTKDWKDNLMSYGSLEFDFHLKHPLIFNFYKKMVEDFQLEIFKSDQDALLAYSNQLFQILINGCDLSEIEIVHIGFVVKGYNEWFYNNYMKVDTSRDSSIKDHYLKGLDRHLKMIGGKDEGASS